MTLKLHRRMGNFWPVTRLSLSAWCRLQHAISWLLFTSSTDPTLRAATQHCRRIPASYLVRPGFKHLHLYRYNNPFAYARCHGGSPRTGAPWGKPSCNHELNFVWFYSVSHASSGTVPAFTPRPVHFTSYASRYTAVILYFDDNSMKIPSGAVSGNTIKMNFIFMVPCIVTLY